MTLYSHRWGAHMKVEDLIHSRTEVYSVTEEVTVYDAARYLREKQVRAVGVLKPDGKLVGVVSQSDISDKVAAENKCPAWMRVSEVMTPHPITVPPATHLDECVRLMEKHGIYHLPVVDENENLSRHDFRSGFAAGHRLR